MNYDTKVRTHVALNIYKHREISIIFKLYQGSIIVRNVQTLLIMEIKISQNGRISNKITCSKHH